MLLGHMSVEVLREEACDCLYEIVNKGMDPIDKTKLVETLCQVLQSAGLFSIDQVSYFPHKKNPAGFRTLLTKEKKKHCVKGNILYLNVFQ